MPAGAGLRPVSTGLAAAGLSGLMREGCPGPWIGFSRLVRLCRQGLGKIAHGCEKACHREPEEAGMRSRHAVALVHERLFKPAKTLIPNRRRNLVRWHMLVPDFMITA